MSKSKSNSLFRNVMDTLVEARARQASRYVNGALMMLDDETLGRYGIRRDEIGADGVHKKLI